MSDSPSSADSTKRVIPIQADPAAPPRREEMVSLYKKTDKIYPERWRVVCQMALGAGLVHADHLYGLPWLNWGERQAVLFDLGVRRFYIFKLVLCIRRTSST